MCKRPLSTSGMRFPGSARAAEGVRPAFVAAALGPHVGQSCLQQFPVVLENSFDDAEGAEEHRLGDRPSCLLRGASAAEGCYPGNEILQSQCVTGTAFQEAAEPAAQIWARSTQIAR